MNTTFKLEHIHCDLCGNDKYVERYRKPDNWLFLNQFQYPVVECTACGLVYVNPRPAAEEMGRYYPSGYHDGRNDEKHLERYAVQYLYIKPYQFNSVLDVGCARGDWLAYINRISPGLELHGVDAFSNLVNHDFVTFQKALLCEANLKNNFFDLVTAWAVLEHVHSPSAYFEAVSRHLKDGGKFIFLVTNSESLYGKRAYCEDIPRHLYHFSEKTIEQYAKKFSMKIIAKNYDTHFWDARGIGTFYYLLGNILGVNWNLISLNRVNIIQKLAMRIGSFIDSLVFYFQWEARLKKSGIIVFVLEKAE
jgi:2-polyprenyl-3-methyl-5-hydroxy-6-metoxy-1,4-benzoquinol methylase